MPQDRRLLIAILYVACLFALGLYLNGGIPPTGLLGVWFYSAVAALLLGEFLTEPFFTAPKDAIANAVALLVGSVSVSGVAAAVSRRSFQLGRYALLGYSLAVILSAAIAIAFNAREGVRGVVARHAAWLSARLGRARWMFTGLFFASGFAAFGDDAHRVAVLYLSWIIVFVLKPLEGMFRWLASRDAPTPLSLGVVTGFEDPGVVLATISSGRSVELGATLAIRDQTGVVVDLTSVLAQMQVRIAYPDPRRVRVGDPVLEAKPDTLPAFIGHVSPGTSLEELRVDASVAVSKAGVQEGSLLGVPIGSAEALYQVARAEVVDVVEGVRRDLIRIRARKLGAWDEASTSFVPVPWLPSPGSPVSLKKLAAPVPFNEEVIGVVPGTAFGISVDLNDLVTHNTAILGILGSGKTHLAWELIERMLAQGVRVVALDITGRYAAHYATVCGPEIERKVAEAIDQPVADELANTIVENNEAGNVSAFRESLKATLQKFSASDSRLLILNPNGFRVSRKEGYAKFDGTAVTLADLTMVEVTRLISEVILELCQETWEDTGNSVEPARVCLVLEEAHALVPEWGSVAGDQEKTAVNGTVRAILQGRKYGLGCLLITQRTANVTKSILNQCNTVFALRNYDATGAGFLENYMGGIYAGLITSLPNRHAIIFGKASSCDAPIIVRLNDRAEFDRGFWDRKIADVPPTTFLDPISEAGPPAAGPAMDFPYDDNDDEPQDY